MPLPSSPRLGALATLLAVTGCSEAPVVADCVPGVETCQTPDPTDEVVAGVNLTALFAAATPAEADAASARRPTAPAAGTVEAMDLADVADGARRVLLTLRNGPTTVAHAVARVPGPRSAVTALPVVVVLPDGTEDVGPEAARAVVAGLADETVQVVVAYRGTALRLGDETAASDAEADPYRADVPDLLAVLAALGRVPRASGPVALVGTGRGGTVALLTALAAPAVDAVVTFGAPTDLLAPSVRDDVRTLLRGEAVVTPAPAFDALAAPVLALRDGAIDRPEARARLLALSPAYGAERLPAVFALHAVGDDVVGDDHLTRLGAALRTGDGTPRFTERVEGVTHATLPADPGVRSRTAAFLRTTL